MRVSLTEGVLEPSRQRPSVGSPIDLSSIKLILTGTCRQAMGARVLSRVQFLCSVCVANWAAATAINPDTRTPAIPTRIADSRPFGMSPRVCYLLVWIRLTRALLPER